MSDEPVLKVGGKSKRPTVRSFLLLWLIIALVLEIGWCFVPLTPSGL